MENMSIIGKRVAVTKEQIECGGLRLTPALEEDGQKNRGIIVAVGQVGLLARFRGVRKGARIVFHKHFTSNHGGDNPICFVELDQILGVFE